jgi:hypothetical protein
MNKIIGSITLVAAFLPTWAGAAPAHVHGIGELHITVEGNQLTLAIESPLDPFLGFERPPRTTKEKETYAATLKTLNDPAALFKPSEAALCKVKSVKVSEPFPGGKANPSGHADIDAEYIFQCEKPTELKGVEAPIFKAFPKLSKLNVKRVGPNGQGAGKLTPKNAGLSW